MTTVYSNYDSKYPLMAVLEFTAPTAGNLHITSIYTLKSSGTLEFDADIFDRVNEAIENFFPGMEKPKRDFQANEDKVSFGHIMCYTNGIFVEDKSDKGFSNTLLKWEQDVPMAKGDYIKAVVFRENVRADPVQDIIQGTDKNGFLLIGQFG